MEALALLLAALLAHDALPPQPLDTKACILSHGFMIGEAPNHPAGVEIWACDSTVVVTLTQFGGAWNARAWKVNYDTWRFDEVAAGDVLCNRDFALR